MGASPGHAEPRARTFRTLGDRIQRSGHPCAARSCRHKQLRESGELAWQEIDALLDGPYLRTFPGVQPCDGFFAAVLEKRG